VKTLYQLKNIELQERSSLYELMLKDAGWDVLDVKGQIMPSKACIEVEATGKVPLFFKNGHPAVLDGRFCC